jgi:CheY-like chemotaxis protein
MKRSEGDPAMVQQALDTIDRQMKQMERLVDDLLDVSRIRLDKVILRLQRVDLQSILQQSVEVCRSLATQANHSLTVTLPQEPLELSGDLVRLAQSFSNLLNNACKYTPPGGTVSVTAERDGNHATVSIADTGMGIPADMLPRVFEMFTQIDRSAESAQSGLGIGLSLAKRLVGMHGGTIEAFSDGPGEGSRFVVRLPLLADEPAAVRPAPVVGHGAETPRRILVVDDNRDSVASLTLLLELDGHELCSAHDGLEAVAAAERFRPDVVLLDVGLPKLNGHDAARRIRAQPWGRDMSLFAVTGWGQDEDRRKSEEAGFDAHLVKPIDFRALKKLLGSAPSREPS